MEYVEQNLEYFYCLVEYDILPWPSVKLHEQALSPDNRRGDQLVMFALSRERAFAFLNRKTRYVMR